MRILGREPALIVGAVNALIMLAGTLGFSVLAADQAGLWVAAVNALSAAILAWTTRPLAPGPIALAIAAFVALGNGYGLTLTPEQVNAINGALVPILLFLTRGQVSPVETAVTKPSKNPLPEAEPAFTEDPVPDEGDPVDVDHGDYP